MGKLTATICLTLAVLLGSAGVSRSADLQKGLIAAQSGDYATSFRELTPLAKQGNANAQYQIGWMSFVGRGVPQDDKTAVKWWKLAADQGLGNAQYNLGNMYRHGDGVRQDDKTAVKWYRLAAEQGFANAQYNLSGMYGDCSGHHTG